MKKKFISLILICILLTGCSSANSKKENIVNSASILGSESSSSSEPTWLDKTRNEIYLYLYNHNDISKNFKTITIEGGEHGIHFNVTLDAYETYTFAAVTSATMDIVGKLVKESDIKQFQIQVSSPLDAKYFVHWKTTDLNGGILADTGPGGHTGYYTLDQMLKIYGYEDYESKLENSFASNNENSSSISNYTPKVYVASSGNGKKYHRRKNCSGMNGNATLITLEQAKSQGYSACKICC